MYFNYNDVDLIVTGVVVLVDVTYELVFLVVFGVFIDVNIIAFTLQPTFLLITSIHGFHVVLVWCIVSKLLSYLAVTR